MKKYIKIPTYVFTKKTIKKLSKGKSEGLVESFLWKKISNDVWKEILKPNGRYTSIILMDVSKVPDFKEETIYFLRERGWSTLKVGTSIKHEEKQIEMIIKEVF